MDKIISKQEIKSPLTNEVGCKLLQTYSVKQIEDEYKSNFGVDTSYIFSGITQIELYECPATGYRFFYPFNIAGDSGFYEKFQQFEWYYMPWKWEHRQAMKYIRKTDKILEVGSGGGGFLKKLNKNGYDITGLELNKDSINKCREAGLNVLDELVENHARNHQSEYDVVCTFQVLEHIADVHSFLQACLDCLKPDGKFIVCVPNNDSFIRRDKNGILNGPPHHMGLWTIRSLKKIKEIFSLSKVQVLIEPLQDYHYSWYLYLKEDQLNKAKLSRKLYYKLRINHLAPWVIKVFSSFIVGHSVMAVFEK